MTDIWLLKAITDYTDSSGNIYPVGSIVNRIHWDGISNYIPPTGLELIPDDGSPIYEFPQVIIIPDVEMWKLKITMLNTPSKLSNSSNLLNDANNLANFIGNAIELAWNNATFVQRDSITINAMAPELGLSQTDIDNLFLTANLINM